MSTLSLVRARHNIEHALLTRIVLVGRRAGCLELERCLLDCLRKPFMPPV